MDKGQVPCPFCVYYSLTGESVHLAEYPHLKEEQVDQQLEKQMQAVLEIVELGRSVRNKHQVKTKQPLSKMVVVSNLNDMSLKSFEDIIRDELNVKTVEWADSSNEYIEYKLKLNFKTAGPKLGKVLIR